MSDRREIRVKGSAVSRGFGIGKAVCIFGERQQFLRRSIAALEIDSEIARFEAALETAKLSIDRDIEIAGSGVGGRAAEILESHLVILADPELRRTIKESITSDRANAEWAVQSSFDQYSDAIRSSDGRFREMSLDLTDVAERLLSALAGKSTSPTMAKGSVVAAPELRASTLLHLREAEVTAIVTEHGGWTSHSSILAREFGIPYVTGIAQLFGYVSADTVIAVDGNAGEIVFDPSDDTMARFEARLNGIGEIPRVGSPPIDDRLQTLDGRRIVLRTNTTSLESYAIAKGKGAEGIGLFRSEALIAKYGRIPTEDEQIEMYRRISSATGSEGLRIRTFDIESEARQKNPALGLRAIRLGLQKRELLIPQLRAILRASFGNSSIKVVIPMISDGSEMDAVRSLLIEQSLELETVGIPFGMPEIGAMIEIPSAALLADQLAASADFLCLGTNDLAQYVLAADRDNETVSEWFRTLHPAMLRLVKSVIDACRHANTPLVVCGEMAGSPFYVPVLIGMGADELSVGPASVEPVRRVLAGIAYEEAAELVREVLKFSNPDDIEDFVAETAKHKWIHLYPSGFFEQYGR